MTEEIDALRENDTYELTTKLKDRSVIYTTNIIIP